MHEKKKKDGIKGEWPSYSLGNLEFRADSCFSGSDRGTGCSPDHIQRYLQRSSKLYPVQVSTVSQHIGLWEHIRGPHEHERSEVSSRMNAVT